MQVISVDSLKQLIFDESISIEAISSLSGIDRRTLDHYRNENRAFENMPLKNALKLSDLVSDTEAMNKVAELSKLDPGLIERQVKREELADLLYERIKQIGRLPHSYEFTKRHQVVLYYGSWHNFLTELGFRDNPVRKGKKSGWNPEELIEDFNERAQNLGRQPKSYEYLHYDVVKRYFGTWAKFLKAVTKKSQE